MVQLSSHGYGHSVWSILQLQQQTGSAGTGGIAQQGLGLLDRG